PDCVGKTSCIKYLNEMYPDIYEKSNLAFPTYKLNEVSKTPMYLRKKLSGYLNKTMNVSHTMFQLINLIDKVCHYDILNEYSKSKKVYLIDRFKPSAYVYGMISLQMSSEMSAVDAAYLCTLID